MSNTTHKENNGRTLPRNIFQFKLRYCYYLSLFDKRKFGAITHIWTRWSEESQEALYDGLLCFIDDLAAALADTDTIQVADKNTFLFMHDNVMCHKTSEVSRLLIENNVSVMKWLARSPDLKSYS